MTDPRNDPDYIRGLMRGPVQAPAPPPVPEASKGYERARRLIRSTDEKDQERAMQWAKDHPHDAAMGCLADRDEYLTNRLFGPQADMPPATLSQPSSAWVEARERAGLDTSREAWVMDCADGNPTPSSGLGGFAAWLPRPT